MANTIQSPIWGVQFGSNATDYVSHVGTDRAGDIYAVGGTLGRLPGETGAGDQYIARFSCEGRQLWIRQFGTAQGDDGCSALVDASGSIYVVGDTYGALYSGAPPRDMAAFIAKFDTNGTLLWGKQLTGSGASRATCISQGPDGCLYVAGYTNGDLAGRNAGLDPDPTARTGSDDLFLLKFGIDGSQLWAKQFGGTGDDDPSAIELDSDGNIVLVGFTYHWFRPKNHIMQAFVAKFSPDGTIQWGRQFSEALPNGAGSVYIDSKGNIYAGISEGGDIEGYGDICGLWSFDPSGTLRWTTRLRTLGSNDRTYITALTGLGPEIYAAGYTSGDLFCLNGGSDNMFTVRVDLRGRVVSGNQLKSGSDDRISNVVCTPSGQLLIAGTTTGSLFATKSGHVGVYVVKLGAKGPGRVPFDANPKNKEFADDWSNRLISASCPYVRRDGTVYLFARCLRRGLGDTAAISVREKEMVVETARARYVFDLDKKRFAANGTNVAMSAAPILVDGHFCIPIDAFQYVCPCRVAVGVKEAALVFEVPMQHPAEIPE